MPRKIVGLVLAVLVAASLLGERPFVANVASAPDGTQHVVKSGETPGAIAALYGVTVDQLVAQNSLPDPDRVAEGQTLRIPATESATARATTAPAGSTTASQTVSNPAPASVPAAQRAPVEYVVQPGDNLSGIAKALGVTQKALLDANALTDPDRLTVGQKLTVPVGAQPASQAAAPTSPQAANPSTASGSTQSSAPMTAQAATGTPADAGALLDKLAQQYGVDKALVRALAWSDTNGKPRTLDPPGGIGYLKVTDPTFEFIQQTLVKRQLDRNSPADNVEAGIAYLAAMLKWGGEEAKGLAGFIQGPGSVTANGVRPATDDQVKRVLALREKVKQGDGQQAPPPGAAQGPSTTGPPAAANQPATGPRVNLPANTPATSQGPTASPPTASQPTANPPAASPPSTAPQNPAANQPLPPRTGYGAGTGVGAGTGAGAGANVGAAPRAGTNIGPTAPNPGASRTAPGEQTASLAARVIGAARSVAGAQARIGISGHNLVTGQRISIAADESFPAASVDKLALLAEAYRQQQSGSRTLTDAQQSDLRAMIVQSDNDAANRLLELFGPRAVNSSLQALGLAGTRLLNPFGSATPGGRASNVTTPADMTRFMDLLVAEQLVSVQASREMRALLLQTQDGSKLRRGLPTDARLAHKSGWYEGVCNDVGIVSQGGVSYVISVFTDGIADAEVANQTIAAVAKVIHESWGPN